MKIQKIHAREILDSRGNPTVEVDVVLENLVLPLVRMRLSSSATVTRTAIWVRVP